MKNAIQLFSEIQEYAEAFDLQARTDSHFEAMYYNNASQLAEDGFILHSVSPRSVLKGLKIKFVFSEGVATYADGTEIMSIVVERGIVINDDQIGTYRVAFDLEGRSIDDGLLLY